MYHESTKKTLFSLNCEYAKGVYQSVSTELTEGLLQQTRAAKLSQWVYNLGTQRYRELVNAHESQEQDEARIRRAHEEVAKLNNEFRQEHSNKLHVFYHHDGKGEDPMKHSVSKFCETSVLITSSGSLQDKKAVLKKWEDCLDYARAMWTVFKNIEGEVEDLHENAVKQYRKLQAVEGSTLRFPSKPHSGQDIKDIVHVAFNLDSIKMRAQLVNGVYREDEWRVEDALSRIERLWSEMEWHKERLGVRQREASKKSTNNSSANRPGTHAKYKVMIEVNGYNFSNEVYIRDGSFCRAKTERAKPKRGEDEAKWRPPKYEALLETRVNPPRLILKELKGSTGSTFSETDIYIELPSKSFSINAKSQALQAAPRISATEVGAT